MKRCLRPVMLAGRALAALLCLSLLTVTAFAEDSGLNTSFFMEEAVSTVSETGGSDLTLPPEEQPEAEPPDAAEDSPEAELPDPAEEQPDAEPPSVAEDSLEAEPPDPTEAPSETDRPAPPDTASDPEAAEPAWDIWPLADTGEIQTSSLQADVSGPGSSFEGEPLCWKITVFNKGPAAEHLSLAVTLTHNDAPEDGYFLTTESDLEHLDFRLETDKAADFQLTLDQAQLGTYACQVSVKQDETILYESEPSLTTVVSRSFQTVTVKKIFSGIEPGKIDPDFALEVSWQGQVQQTLTLQPGQLEEAWPLKVPLDIPVTILEQSWQVSGKTLTMEVDKGEIDPAGDPLITVTFSSDDDSTEGRTVTLTNSYAEEDRTAQLSVTQANYPDRPILVGDSLTYTIRVKNLGHYPAENVVVFNPLNDDLVFLGYQVSGQAQINQEPEDGRYPLGNIAPGEAAVLYLSAEVTEGAAGKSLENRPVVFWDNPPQGQSKIVCDPISAKVAEHGLTVTIQAQRKDGTDWVPMGDFHPARGAVVHYIVTVKNNGLLSLSGLTVSNLLDSKVNLISDVNLTSNVNPFPGGTVEVTHPDSPPNAIQIAAELDGVFSPEATVTLEYDVQIVRYDGTPVGNSAMAAANLGDGQDMFTVKRGINLGTRPGTPKIFWYDGKDSQGGSLLYTQDLPEDGKIPEKDPPQSPEGQVFLAWKAGVPDPVTGDITLTAQWGPAEKKILVAWMDGLSPEGYLGSLPYDSEDEISPEDCPMPLPQPQRKIFDHWERQDDNGFILFVAIWKDAVPQEQVTVVWYSGIEGQPPLKTKQYPAGTQGEDIPLSDYPYLPDPPAGKAFDRWQIAQEGNAVSITAQWREAPRLVFVIWYDGLPDQGVLATKEYPSGTRGTEIPLSDYPALPQPPSGMVFDRWDIRDSWSGIDITALWKAGEPVTAVWYSGIPGQPPLKTGQYPAGTRGADIPLSDYPALPQPPEGQVFDRWVIEEGQSGISITIQWKDISGTVAVVWYSGIPGQPPLKTGQYPAGTRGADIPLSDYPALPQPPEGQVFDRWEIGESPEGISITACWKAAVQITVTWYDGYSGGVVKQISLPRGERPSSSQYPAQPSRSGYRFTGWSSPSADQAGNLTIYAQ